MRSQVLGKLVLVCLCTCVVGTPSWAAIVYVDAAAPGANDGSSWADAFRYLQDALAAVASADKPVEIRVAQGIYKPDQGTGITPGEQAATFRLLNDVTLKGGYAGTAGPDPNARDVGLYETILSGDLKGNDVSVDDPHQLRAQAEPTRAENSQHVVTASATDRTAVIDGFTITAGYGSGAGILIDAGSPTVLNCRLTGNVTQGSGGAVLTRNASCPRLADCTILGNYGTGIDNLDDCNSVLSNCRFEGNAGDGMHIRNSSPAMTGCLFTGNGGYGIFAWGCNSVLTDCVFQASGTVERERGINAVRGNLALTGCTFTGLSGGCIDVMSGDLSLDRCTFTGSSNMSSGAVRCRDSVTARQCTFVGNSGWTAGAISCGRLELENCEFIGNSGSISGAVDVSRDLLIATGCLFSGNSSEHGAGAISGHSLLLLLTNCTFAGNRGRPNAIEYWIVSAAPQGRLTQCILRDGPNPFAGSARMEPKVTVTYSDVQGGYPGEGNADIDPCFVSPGYWADPNDPGVEARADDPCAVWVPGDYHLKSQGGHWDRATQSWVRDEVTSACIDAGDPNSPIGAEPFPNGGFVNMGAYGATAEASKSYFGEPICETQLAGDINGDCKVDQADMDILMLHWLMDATVPMNTPPIVTVTSPQDGAELTSPTPIVFQAEASDPDGTVVRVKYVIQHLTDTGGSTGSTTVFNSADGWRGHWNWTNIHYDGVYTIWAEAMDNEGATTISPKITATLHRTK